MKRKSIDGLLTDRAGLVAKINAIDAELLARGVRPIQTVVGRPRDVAEAIYRAMSDGPKSTAEIEEATGCTHHATAQMLSKMTLTGELRRVSRGVYALPERAS